jgi:DNA polymerase
MRARDLLLYSRELGWSDPPEFQDVDPAASAGTPDARPDACTDLHSLQVFLEGCRRCRLADKRSTIVFGEGHPDAEVMFVGEGPGADEDRTGRPFVGQAGQLLDGMIRALGLDRRDVYIANVVKCRPPGNRDPQDDEMGACAPFLERQVELIRPQVIVALGRIAAQRLTGTSKPIGALRGSWTSYRGTPLLATYHPAYLLRQPLEKRRAWDDLKLVRARLAEA